MTAVAIAALVLATTLLGTHIWTVVKLVKKTETKAESDVLAAEQNETIARLEGELSLAVRDAGEAWRQAEQLAEGLQHALQQSPSVATGLAADDVGGRLRAFRRLAEARDSADPLPGGTDAVLPQGDPAVAHGRPAATGGGT